MKTIHNQNNQKQDLTGLGEAKDTTPCADPIMQSRKIPVCRPLLFDEFPNAGQVLNFEQRR